VIADLHCHYPMHLLADEASPSKTYDLMVNVRRRPRWVDRLRVIAFRLFAQHFNYRDHASGWRVTFDGLERAQVRLVCSVLFQPFAEIDLDEPPRAAPEEGYFADLIEQLDRVEAELQRIDPARARHLVVKSADDLAAAQATGRMAFIHCIEGGFHLGHTPDAIAANVAELARRGTGYVTLAHLFYRQIATNANALPMLSDAQYGFIFSQPRGVGLAKLGEAAVRAMYEQRILIDVSHMSPDSLTDTFALLDKLDAERGAAPTDYPVIASHAGYRFGKQSYMLTAESIRQIARRGGVIGLILARHQLQDGRGDGEGIDHTVETVRAHVDKIREITGSNDHVGIGSDLDGFIKPTMSGIEAADDLAKLEDALRRAYPDAADAILWQNASRVVTRVLAQRPLAAA
jgi:microsomal dipeptidase-like Zn-dependent dipeptidase